MLNDLVEADDGVESDDGVETELNDLDEGELGVDAEEADVAVDLLLDDEELDDGVEAELRVLND
ncbi:hypothetical protein CCP1ISM_1170002 [Azospirillaceae bacterium]